MFVTRIYRSKLIRLRKDISCFFAGKIVDRNHYANPKENILLTFGGDFMQPPTRPGCGASGGGLCPSLVPTQNTSNLIVMTYRTRPVSTPAA